MKCLIGKAECCKEKAHVWNALLLAMIPVVCAVLRCALDGKLLTDIYLPASQWNDELFYYKLTEGVLSNGVPQGYFGFNESHGRYLSFAAWSPVLLISWVIYGVVFGWNLLSPIFANMLAMSLAMFAFGMLAKPNKVQTAMITGLYICFVPATRFVLSCIPEAELFALFIVFWGLVLSCQKSFRGYKIGVLFALIVLMVWMRPYLILLILTPMWLWLQQSEKTKKQTIKILGVGTTVFGISLGSYALINYMFSAPYLTDLFYTEWIKKYFTDGVLEGLKYTLWKLWMSFKTMLGLIKQNLVAPESTTSAAGLYYVIFLVLILALACRVIHRGFVKKVNWSSLLLELQMLLCMIGFFVADLLMYRIQEGGRHTLVYLVGMIVLFPYMEREVWDDEKSFYTMLQRIRKHKAVWWKTVGMVVGFLFLFIGRGNVPYEFAVPYRTEEHSAELDKLSKQLEEKMQLSEEGIGYDNTVIWTFWDTVENAASDNPKETVVEGRRIDFGAYYAVPAGFGINLCDGGYMDVNLESLQSRYIGTVPGGNFEKRCIDAGGVLIGECDRLVVYDMRP